jgi:hypothetical protein
MPRTESGPQQFIWVRSDGLTNCDKFHDVDPSFAAFVGDEGLRLMKPLCQLMLGQSGRLPSFDHSSQKAVWPSEWTDLSSLRAREAIGAKD